jgi:Tfp pilus assembly protein PilF
MAQTYKVKLESGRVLGPLDLERIRLLVLKNQIVGKELARVYPRGDWLKITSIPEISSILLARAAGRLTKDSTLGPDSATRGSSASTHILAGATEAFPVEFENERPPPTFPVVAPSFRGLTPDETEQGDKTVVAELTPTQAAVDPKRRGELLRSGNTGYYDLAGPDNQVSEFASNVPFEQTIMIGSRKKKVRMSAKEAVKATVAAIALGIAGYMVLFPEPEKALPAHIEPVRPALPAFQQGAADPNQSQKIYLDGLKAYVSDTVIGYRQAAEKFSRASALDQNNVKAIALLASSYLNLIDSSNKDENYFSVISKLIDMTRAKNVDLTETVIADVEFFCVVNKAEAAENRIVEYTKTHPNFSLDMFYYLALAFYTRGDFQSASRYISQIPDNKAFSAKVFYLEGQIAEKLSDSDTALNAYGKSLQINKIHAKSRLRISDILNQRGRIGEAKGHLEFLVTNPFLLSPKDLGLAYYLHSVLSEQRKNYEIALGDAERAVNLNKDDHNYLLQLYSMRAKAGESIVNIRKDAKMYYYLGEGERLLKEGKYQDALTQFLQARQTNNDSPIPLVKIGDMFSYLHDLGNARINYKMAADRAPNNIDIWSKYIDVLIQSYEWDDANKAMEKFRELPVSQSAIDKAAGDMYAKQGSWDRAQTFYRKAMGRESIDAAVYIAYAKSLMATKNYKEAPFFFALAQRYDPLNIDAVIGTAQCIANTDSVDRAISMLQDQLQRGDGAKAEYLAAIAEFQIQKGAMDLAQKTVDQALSANPDYAYPWKLQGQIYMSRENTDKTALDKALYSYQSYSDRNASDPSGYLERYRIFIKKNEFDKAADELGKIFSIYPKYPNLHFYKGVLYGMMGNHKLAVEEYRIELQNNPQSIDAMLALGKEYIELGGYNEALGQFNKAMSTAPRTSEPKHWSGYANYLLKNFAGAVALLRAALVIDPGNPIIHKRLGMAYRDLGDPKSAAQEFHTYIQMEPDAPDRAEFEHFR